MTNKSPRRKPKNPVSRSVEERLTVLEEANNRNAETLRRSLESLGTQHIKIKVLVEMVCDVASVPYSQFFERCNGERERLINMSKAAEEKAAEADGTSVETFGGDIVI
jgi:hypothetical protein